MGEIIHVISQRPIAFPIPFETTNEWMDCKSPREKARSSLSTPTHLCAQHMPAGSSERAPKRPRVGPPDDTDAPEDRAGMSSSASRRALARLPRYLAFIEYDGNTAHGFQRQANTTLRTVQGALDGALTRFNGNRGDVECVGSSRTDVGVHALRNSVHFDLRRGGVGGGETAHDAATVRNGVNFHLRKMSCDFVRVTECVRVDEMNAEFHARHDAVGRRYAYEILVGPRADDGGSIFDRGRAWYVRTVGEGRRSGPKLARDGELRSLRAGFGTCEESLDVEAMRAAAEALVGTHDFSSFRANGCQASSPIRTVDSITVSERATEWPASEARGTRQRISIGVKAPSFLYHQVRLLVGTLKAVGAGDLSVDDVRALLEAKNVLKAPPMAPACGLYLADVAYLENYARRPSFASAKETVLQPPGEEE